MKKIIMIVVFSAFVTCGLFSPRIHFSEKVHDFGVVEQKAVLKHVFTFQNKGTGKLIIEKIKSG